MLRNNLLRRQYHKYQITFDGKKWYAWYEADLNGQFNQEIEEIQGTSGG